MSKKEKTNPDPLVVYRDKDGVIRAEKPPLDISKMVYESFEGQDPNHRVLHPINR